MNELPAFQPAFIHPPSIRSVSQSPPPPPPRPTHIEAPLPWIRAKQNVIKRRVACGRTMQGTACGTEPSFSSFLHDSSGTSTYLPINKAIKSNLSVEQDCCWLREVCWPCTVRGMRRSSVSPEGRVSDSMQHHVTLYWAWCSAPHGEKR